jgi:hypothetical protein
MGKLWGEGPWDDNSSWSTLVQHTLELDDQVGRQDGYVVRGDEFPLQVLARLLRYVPESAEVRGQLPPALSVRVSAEYGRQARENWLTACHEVLEVATERLSATGGGVYLRHGDEAVLSNYINWTPAEVNYWRRIPMELDQPLPMSIVQARPVWQTNVSEMDLAAVPIGVDATHHSAAGAILLSWLHGPGSVVSHDIEPELEALAQRLTESFELWRPHARPQRAS